LGNIAALSSMVFASHLLPGSGAVDRLTVPAFTQRYTVRACALPMQASASSMASQSATRPVICIMVIDGMRYTGNAVVFFTVRRARVDCTRTTPGSWVRISVWMRSKSAASA
jgi:hypothetical protein